MNGETCWRADMIPISDDNPTLRTPVMTYLLLATLGLVWVFFQGAGFNVVALAASICDLGLVPGELTGGAPLGLAVPLGDNIACVVDNESINLLGNVLFFWVFGNNIEDSMGRLRFLVFYLVCGLVAAAAHVAVDPTSPVPTVGASGAIAGVLGAYLVLYPRVRVNMLFIFFIFFRIFPIPAWGVLLWWFVLQLITGLPQLMTLRPEVSGGVAVWAHIGGFVAGMVLVKLFENPRYTSRRTTWRHRMHPDHP